MSPFQILLLAGCVLFQTTQQLFIRVAAHAPSRAGYFAFVAPAGVCYLLEMLCWFRLLSQVPLGLALPLIAINYAIVPLAAHRLFGEPLDRRRWTGIAFIILGFTLVATQATH